MGNTSTRRPFRRHLAAGVAVGSAGILVVSLVTTPPDVSEPRSEVVAVRLAVLALPRPTSPGTVLDKFTIDQAQTAVPAGQALIVGPTHTTQAAENTAISGQPATAAALPTTTAAINWDQNQLYQILAPIVGPVILFGTIIFGFAVLLPVGWFFGTIYETIANILGLPTQLPLSAAPTEAAEEESTLPAPLSVPEEQDIAKDEGIDQIQSRPGAILDNMRHDGRGNLTKALPAATHDALQSGQRKVRQKLADSRDLVNETIGAVKSAIGNGRTEVRSAAGQDSTVTTANPARKTPVRDAVNKAAGDITKAVTKASEGVKRALGGDKSDKDDADTANAGNG
ncbi:hypothetical protein [Mycobacterium hubeiense]|uniref:hypothetical protein n=1 Tax=Mycobacterium hubeiense TaxID=1867256 RepID=UPI00115A15CB|nr:hypothetical protein [Mycobacterium sp. QGD 101]